MPSRVTSNRLSNKYSAPTYCFALDLRKPKALLPHIPGKWSAKNNLTVSASHQENGLLLRPTTIVEYGIVLTSCQIVGVSLVGIHEESICERRHVE
eukprot:scaffold1211_cov169-Amphora_coffeaeformis.AAC.5